MRQHHVRQSVVASSCLTQSPDGGSSWFVLVICVYSLLLCSVLITSTLFQIVDNPKGVVGEGKDVQSLPEALDDEPLLGMLHRSYREFKVRDLSRRRVLLPD